MPGFGGAQHQRDGGTTGDQVRVYPHLQHPQPAGPVVLPERLVPLHVPVATKDVVDEHVKPPMVALDRRDELGNRGGVLVIDHQRRPRASRRRDQVPGLLDRLGPADLRRPGRPATATSRVDVKARTGKLDRDRTTGAARRPRNQPHSHSPGHNTLVIPPARSF